MRGIIICNPLNSRLFRFEKKHNYLSPKEATIFLGTWLHLSNACAWNSRPTHCSKNAASICFKSTMLSPPFFKAPQTTVHFTFSKALWLQSFLRHKNLNNILFTSVRTGSGITNACMIYTNCEIKNVFIKQTLPAMLSFLFFPCINYSFNVFHPSHPVLFNLRSTFLTGKIHTKNFESPLSCKSEKKMSVQFCLLPSHIASDFIRFISRPENVENSAKIPSACCISCAYPVHISCSYPAHFRLHIVQFLWYFPRGHFVFSNNLILLCSHNVVFLLQAVLPQEQRLVVKRGSPDVFKPLRQNIRITNHSRQHSFQCVP